MLGEGNFGPPRVLSLIRRGQQRLSRELAKCLRLQSAEALGPAAALLRAARKIPADLTIAHNEAAHWVGLQLIAEGRTVAADIEDWHSEDLLDSERAARPLELLRRNETELLHKAAYVTTTSEALAEGLQNRYGGNRPTVVTNSFPLPPLLDRSEQKQNPPSFFWFSQTIGPGRGLEPFLAAYALVKYPSRLTLLGQIRQSYKEQLLSLLPVALHSRVSLHPLVSPDELPSVIAQHNIGLALEQLHPLSRDLTITNKILQYLGAGLAIVATPTAGQLEVLAHSPSAGIFLNQLDTPQQTAAALDSLLANPVELHHQQQAARRLAETRYSWEQEAPRLLRLVEHTIGKSTG